MHESENSKRKPLILIADDDLFIRTTFQDALNADGFETATAPDGESAISSFNSMQPDLVLSI
jgi:CheY-like chemotaxis protein